VAERLKAFYSEVLDVAVSRAVPQKAVGMTTENLIQ
jgi:hypothetical protein